jgi:flagellar protein FlgJ
VAIRPPSDIVLDVAKAADPMRLQAAAAKLARTAAVAGETSFADLMQGAADGPGTESLPDMGLGLGDLRSKLAGVKSSITGMPQAHQALEAYVLQTFVSSLLPKSDNVFGRGTAGEVWKSMLAEQIATKMAKAGGIGITRVLAASAGERASAPTSAGGVDTSRVAPRPAEG